MLGLESPIVAGFEAAAVGKEPPPCKAALESAKNTGLPPHRLAADSDVYKWLEGACYVFIRTGDKPLKKEIDRIVDLILKCQEDDGYINGQLGQKERWDPTIKHDLYIAGHLFEAAAAHYRATNEKLLVEAACRWADYLIDEYDKGNKYYTTSALKEHSEYELGLLRLYRVTGEKKYLDFALTLARELCKVGPKVEDIQAGGGLHAVRVGYLLASMADLYMETSSRDMVRYLEGLWDELVETRMYVTGAIGSIGEHLPKVPYILPHTRKGNNDRSLGETCASVAMVMFSWRMHAITGESKYFDVIEKILYNHYAGAIALNGQGTFYFNPMAMVGDLSEKTDHWHKPASARCMLPNINRTTCCISNAWRFLGALPEYLYSYDEKGLFVNLYSSSKTSHVLSDGRKVELRVETKYPHDGDVKVRFNGEEPTSFKLRLRIPGWCKSAVVKVAGEKVKSVNTGQYHVIEREWKHGDTVELKFKMPVRVIESDPRVKANAGQIVFARGPVLYCLEKEDFDFPVEKAMVSVDLKDIEKQVKVQWHEHLLDGIHVLTVPGRVEAKLVKLKLVPWSVRANRSQDSRWVIFLPLDKAN
ncbi:MAG: glycoside hydrolase family 127 protein [Planctomycetota bacterium]